MGNLAWPWSRSVARTEDISSPYRELGLDAKSLHRPARKVPKRYKVLSMKERQRMLKNGRRGKSDFKRWRLGYA